MENGIRRKWGEGREQVYNFIVNFMKQNCYAPSVREISMGVGLSSIYTVHHHLQKLEAEGRIEMKWNSPRAIKLVGYELVKIGE